MVNKKKSNMANSQGDIFDHPLHLYINTHTQRHTHYTHLCLWLEIWVTQISKQWNLGLTLKIQAHHTYNCLKWPLWYQFLTTCWAFHWFLSHFYTIFLRFIFFKISLVGLEANLCCWLLILALNFTRKLPPNVRFFMEGDDSCCFYHMGFVVFLEFL